MNTTPFYRPFTHQFHLYRAQGRKLKETNSQLMKTKGSKGKYFQGDMYTSISATHTNIRTTEHGSSFESGRYKTVVFLW